MTTNTDSPTPATPPANARRHPALIVLERLLLGGTVEMAGHRWRIAPDQGQLDVCIVNDADSGEEHLLHTGVCLGPFVEMAADVVEAELAIMAAENAMTRKRRTNANVPVYGNLTVES